MYDRRTSLRLKKNLESIIYIGGEEYPATIIDISEEGIAFSTIKTAPIKIGDCISITVHEKYMTTCKDEKIFSDNINGHIKNICPYENDLIRCGCCINDKNYTAYVQEQYIAFACGI